MKRRITAFLLQVILATSFCLSGCSEPPKTEKEIIIKVPHSNTMNCIADENIKNVYTLLELASQDFMAQYDKNVKIKVVEFESGEETKAITNSFGTSDAADILYDGFFNMSSFIHTGKVVPIEDVLTPEMEKDIYPTFLEHGRFNDKLYMMPYMSSENILIYNREMLEQYGLGEYIDEGEVISEWSIDDWTKILDTLADGFAKEGKGRVPMMMYAKDNQGDTHIMTMLRAFGGDLFDSSNQFDLADNPDIIAALRWLQNGVDRGWYMPAPYYKTMSDNSSKFKMDELTFYNFNLGSSTYSRVKEDYNAETKTFKKYGFVNYPGNHCTIFNEGFEVFDNGDSEKIEIAKDFIRYFYETDKWLECSAGSIPVSKKVMEKYKDDILLLEAFSQNSVNSVDYTHNLPNWQGNDDSVRNVFYKEIALLMLKDADGNFAVTPEECAENLQKKLNAAISEGQKNSTLHD